MNSRISDFINERSLFRASKNYLAAVKRGEKVGQVALWKRYAELHEKRSPELVARMEAKLIRNLRRTIKSWLMRAFFRGQLPAQFVTFAVRLLGLQEA